MSLWLFLVTGLEENDVAEVVLNVKWGPLTRTPVLKVNCLEGSVHDPKAKTVSPQRHLVDCIPYGHHLLKERLVASSRSASERGT